MSDIDHQNYLGHGSHNQPTRAAVFTFSPDAGQQYRLTPVWGRVIALGWLLTMFALICVGASSQMIGRPVIWLDDQRWNALTLTLLVLASCFPLMATALWSLFHGPHVCYVSIIPTIILVILAAVDRHNSPGSAIVTLVLAIAGVCLVAGAFAGRYRLNNSSRATTASN
ncbi:unannotated protein [freshwater metagenome]|uniref:Unannotated protein n=1 Tax=freshwater metagenome TaxID=449393 RepID=A0A6J6V0U3_9ZZZZ|nr:hypothetical protein [Actinomycetota bacterium]MSX15270.1 hypothetical protein [Actinomycetota bacterium]MSX36157.1 hypothetical protein [Actinomycetota bacterium]MSX76897.1 hypothetical protein [Actinomycetota bacterium]MSZ71161.1 hypothetical protein [Actinomycetota bacterium]